MECPKCGAVNPSGAEHCNLCYQSFVERPKEPPVPPATEASAPAGIISPAAAAITDPRTLAWHGGIAAVMGGFAFLVSLGILQAVGVGVFSFVFTDIGVNQANLSFFILLSCLFAFISGGVGGNLAGKRDAVPAVRMLAVLIGLAIWIGLMFTVKPAETDIIIWLTSTAAGTVTSLAAFPLAALFLGLSEMFGTELDVKLAGYGGLGGFAAGLVCGATAWLAYATGPLFGQAVPTGALAVWAFALKFTLIVSAAGFASGAVLWFAIAAAERAER